MGLGVGATVPDVVVELQLNATVEVEPAELEEDFVLEVDDVETGGTDAEDELDVIASEELADVIAAEELAALIDWDKDELLLDELPLDSTKYAPTPITMTATTATAIMVVAIPRLRLVIIIQGTIPGWMI